MLVNQVPALQAIRPVAIAAGLLAFFTLGCKEPETAHDPPTRAPQDQARVAKPLAEANPKGAVRPRTVYVPAYSHLPRGPGGERQAMMSILLSIRNVDSTATISLRQVDYYDTPGHRVRGYLEAPRTLGPLQTAEFWVDTHDDAGGSGANFLVEWEGPSDAHPLLTEAVMFADLGSAAVAFTSRGVELDRRTDGATEAAAPSELPSAAPASP